MREFKFRAWDTESSRMVYDPYFFDVYHFSDENRVNQKTYRYYEDWRDLEDGRGWECELMQYVGLKDKNGKEIYEGDIFRIEESGTNGEPDEIFYVVITWIKEWCMFGSLIAKSEYQDYIDNGVKALDEPLFWTYTLEDTDSRKHFLCGNIYENPNLLK